MSIRRSVISIPGRSTTSAVPSLDLPYFVYGTLRKGNTKAKAFQSQLCLSVPTLKGIGTIAHA